MKKKRFVGVILGVLITMSFGLAHAVETFRVPTELIFWDQARAFNGYNLWYPQRGSTGRFIYLMDMEGNIVHTWPGGSNPKLADVSGASMGDGHVLTGLTEMDWDGNVVFDSEESSHHDSWKMFNKKLNAYTYIGLQRFTATNEEIWAAGGDPSIDYVAEGRHTRHDSVVEVDMNGTVIWKWRFLDHTIQDRDAAWPNYVGDGNAIADYPGKVDAFWTTDNERNQSNGINPTPGIRDDWQHLNALDYNVDLGYLAINSKAWSEFWVIDHEATFVSTAEDFAADPVAAAQANIDAAASDAGDFIYRFGNPSAYQQGDPPGYLYEGHQQMYGSHNIEWIDEGYPGAGNFLIFDNGAFNPRGYHSEILEFNPYISGVDEVTGEPIVGDVYVNPPDAGYDGNNNSNQIVWSYRSNMETSFYSSGGAGVQRQPNGNTLICATRQGHVFEVTPDGDVVWEYQVPVGQRGIVKERYDSDGQNFRTFRVYRYGPDFPAFAGKDLTPLGPITEMFL